MVNVKIVLAEFFPVVLVAPPFLARCLGWIQ